MQQVFSLLVLTLTLSFTSPALSIGEACGAGGVCIDRYGSDASGCSFQSGLCPGAYNIQCCLNKNWGSCSYGSCMHESSCSGSVYSGLCPGPSSIKCCSSGSTSPPSNSGGPSATGDCSAYDVDILTKTCVGEYGHGSFQEKMSVLLSIRNRKNDYRWPGTYAEVALQPWQYSCWNANYRYRIENLGPGDSQYDACLPVVRDMCSNYQDITHGANHYYANYIAEPSWVDWDKFTVQVGLHYFFKL